MPSAPPAASSVVLYAKDKGRVAEFYRRTLALEVIDEQDDFVVLGSAGLEVNVVRMSEALARSVSIASPPVPRENTAVKPSFLVLDLAQARAAAQETGGDTKALAKAWRWRGQLHLDGHDPEGNVVQFRQCEA